MIGSDRAERYARALFNLIPSEKERNEVLKVLEQVHTVINQPKLKQLFSAPQVNDQQKIRVLQSIFKHLHPKSLAFLSMLLKRDMIKSFSAIVHKYKKLIEVVSGMHYVRFVTPSEIDEESKSIMQKKLEEWFGKKFEIITEIDPSVIGGGILLFDNNLMMDFSIKNQLNRLQKELTQVV